MALVQHFAALKPVTAPVCSVCIANYNGVDVLTDCIESVLAQQGDIPVEIIIHDDASTDDSVAWLRQRYPDVEILAGNDNAGFCVSNNRMVAHARGEYVLLLNNDAALQPDGLATLLDAARKLPQGGILTLPQYDWQSGALVDRGCMLDPFYNPVPNLDAKRGDVAYVIGACLFLPRALWIDLGGFPEWMGSIAEDMYLCCLARLRGLPVAVTGSSGYRHWQGATFGGNRIDSGRLNTTYRRRALSERNKTAVLIVCTPTLIVWPWLVVHSLAQCVEGGALCALKKDRRIWREIYRPALCDTAHHLGRARIMRTMAQRNRQISLWCWLRVFVVMPRKITLLWRHGLPTVQ